jgi:hypothetical protein
VSIFYRQQTDKLANDWEEGDSRLLRFIPDLPILLSNFTKIHFILTQLFHLPEPLLVLSSPFHNSVPSFRSRPTDRIIHELAEGGEVRGVGGGSAY